MTEYRLHWYTPPAASSDHLETYLGHLHPLGIRWAETDVRAYYYTDDDNPGQLLKMIGTLTNNTATGIITAHAYRACSDWERIILARCAANAFERFYRPGWSYVRKAGKGESYWRTGTSIRVDEDDPIGQLAAKAAAMAHRYGWRTDRAIEANLGADLT